MIKVIGKHKVKHSNVMLGIDDLMAGQKADVMYSDPPWGQGNLNYWQTINKRHTGTTPEEINLDAFINQIFSIAKKHSKGVVFIEYGMKWEKQIISYGESHGLIHIGRATPKYKAGSVFLPLHLHIFHREVVVMPEDYFLSINDTFGIETLRRAIDPFVVPDGIALDPCCGMGYTARIAVENGMAFRGNELNAKRLQKTIDFLEKNK